MADSAKNGVTYKYPYYIPVEKYNKAYMKENEQILRRKAFSEKYNLPYDPTVLPLRNQLMEEYESITPGRRGRTYEQSNLRRISIEERLNRYANIQSPIISRNFGKADFYKNLNSDIPYSYISHDAKDSPYLMVGLVLDSKDEYDNHWGMQSSTKLKREGSTRAKEKKGGEANSASATRTRTPKPSSSTTGITRGDQPSTSLTSPESKSQPIKEIAIPSYLRFYDPSKIPDAWEIGQPKKYTKTTSVDAKEDIFRLSDLMSPDRDMRMKAQNNFGVITSRL